MIMRVLHRSLTIMLVVWFASGNPMASADVSYGSYLAGRSALQNSDYTAAAHYFGQALETDPNNHELLQSMVFALLAIGEVDRALPIAERLEDQGAQSGIADLVILSGMAKTGEFASILNHQATNSGLVGAAEELIVAWAHKGAGSVIKSLDSFDQLAARDNIFGIGKYHKGLALALVGDFERAEAILAEDMGGGLSIGRRGVIARIEILSQLDRNADALQVLGQFFGKDFDLSLSQKAAILRSGDTLPFDHVTSVQEGIAEVFFSLAAIYDEADQEVAPIHSLIYGRLAADLRPTHVDAILLVAQILDELEQFELAIDTYKLVPKTSPDFVVAEQGRASTLNGADKSDAAIEVLNRLIVDYPNLPSVYSALGGLYREGKDYKRAVAVYDRAIELTAEGSRSEWYLYFVRGISHERLGQWEQAESDFRKTLAIRPQEPGVLNYLGYSMVEKGVNLDEALDMIQRAVAARPNSGHIVDSLGWVLYRLGRYDEAVEHLERAVELEPTDPVINDHLGDAYWAEGRIREAEFQWKRALSYVDESSADVNQERIRRKIDIGLDSLLAEEGAPPLSMAGDDL